PILDAKQQQRIDELAAALQSSPDRPADALHPYLERERKAIIDGSVKVMVMEDMPNPRPTDILVRGAYEEPGEQGAHSRPPGLGDTPSSPANRLDLARWLMSDDHPLTARVTANRLWQMPFGNGLVVTQEDFGTQGTPPSHPELLDWLATELI